MTDTIKQDHIAMFAEAISDVVGIGPDVVEKLRTDGWQEGLKELARRVADLANEARADTPDHRAIKERFLRDLLYLQECEGFDPVREKLLDVMHAVNRTDFDTLAERHTETLKRVDAKLGLLMRTPAETHDVGVKQTFNQFQTDLIRRAIEGNTVKQQLDKYVDSERPV